MNKLLIPFIFMCSIVALNGFSQTIYVDAARGNERGTGTSADPFPDLEKAVASAAALKGDEPVIIKIYPGVYTLQHLLVIRTANSSGDTGSYTLEAAVMPDESDWNPYKMPVIQSVSSNNTTTQFPHAAGILVARNNTHFHGLKFLGNANPGVMYYYPLTRENENYRGMEISQCYFIGEKNSAPIQGAVFAHGPGILVDHCIFYGCKNALLLFRSISDFSVTHSIFIGAYESAVWFGPFTSPFVFSNNIVTQCNYFWARPDSSQPAYHFSNSLITRNTHDMGYYTNMGLIPAGPNKAQTETDIRKTGNPVFSEVKTEGIPKDYLNPLSGSEGVDLDAGIFKKPKTQRRM